MNIFGSTGANAGSVKLAVAPDVMAQPRAHFGRPAKARGWLSRIIWTAVTLCAMAGTVDLLLDPPAFLLQRPQEAKLAAPGWSEIRKPMQVYAFSGGQFGRQPDQYNARRHDDGSRKDTLGFGSFAALERGEGEWLRLSIHRMAGRSAKQAGLFLQLARLAAEEGLSVTRKDQPDLVQTRFGALTVSDIEVSGEKTKAACLGYSRVFDRPSLVISGIACGPAGRPMDRKSLACALNRLDVVSARDDVLVSELFARTELNRDRGCTAGRLAGMRDRASWLDQPDAGEAIGALRLKRASERTAMRQTKAAQ